MAEFEARDALEVGRTRASRNHWHRQLQPWREVGVGAPEVPLWRHVDMVTPAVVHLVLAPPFSWCMWLSMCSRQGGEAQLPCPSSCDALMQWDAVIARGLSHTQRSRGGPLEVEGQAKRNATAQRSAGPASGRNTARAGCAMAAIKGDC